MNHRQLRVIILLLFSATSLLAGIESEFKTGNFTDSIYVDYIEQVNGDTVQLDIVVSSFDDIAAAQWSFSFENEVEFLSLESDFVTPFNFGVFPESLTFSWLDAAGVTLVDGEVFFSLKFLKTGLGNGNIRIVDSPVSIYATNVDEEEVLVILNGGGLSLVTGSVFHDENENCTYEEGENLLPHWQLTLSNGHTVKTRKDGTFRKYLPEGSYTATLAPKDELWSSCSSEVPFTVTKENSEDLKLGARAIVDCARAGVSVAIPFLRRCVENKYFVTYCNYGTVEIDAPEMNIGYGEDFSYNGSSIDPETITEGNLLIYGEPLGIGECKTLSVLFTPNCETTAMGETHCVTATIAPFDNCIETQNWTGADVTVEAECEEGVVNFKIKNKGAGDMGGPKRFIVIEDDVMMPQPDSDYDIDIGDSIEVAIAAQGKTLRLIAEQEDFHPFPNMPTISVEGCGVNEDGSFSLGFVNQFSESDNAPFVDLFCAEIIGAFDPNDKQGFPKGYSEDQLIYSNTDMEYLIRFQNTGNDTAFNVVILDTIQENFDLRSIQVGPGSHPFTWDIIDERIVEFTFRNILLPDSIVDEAASHGFIKYKIKQVADHEDGTVLENTASIYFDFNEPILTNTTTHTIGSTFILSSIENSQQADEEAGFKIYPNPSNSGVWIEQVTNYKSAEIIIYSVEGKLIKRSTSMNSLHYIPKNDLAEGLNFYTIATAGGKTYSGKITVLK